MKPRSKAPVLFIRLATAADKRRLDRAAARERLGTSAWARRVLILAAQADLDREQAAAGQVAP